MVKIKCCVPNCTSDVHTYHHHHRFPNPNKELLRFQAWTQAINNHELVHLTPLEVYKLKRVCRIHFEQQYFTCGSNRVHRNAVPTLFLSGNQSTYAVTSQPSTSVQVLQTENSAMEVETAAIAKRSIKTRQHKKVTPYSILRGAGVNIVSSLTPREKFLYGHIKKLYRAFQGMSRGKHNFRKRLSAAKKLLSENNIEETLCKLNVWVAQFIRCQVREANKSGKQRRFTTDDKILALSLYNQSPKAYRFLSKVFVLPSKSTLNVFLHRAFFTAGINLHLFEALKRSTENMDPSDKYVSVIFDEMSIKPGIYFNEKDGFIHGFEDMGEGSRTHEMADHVLVFMVRGIKKKFKQPICYTFSSKGGAKAPQICKLLKQIIHLLLDIDLKPITTICDQAPTNVKVIKTLMEDTKGEYLRRGNLSYMEGSFVVKGFTIFPIYDPPHLLKGIRNNFVTKWLQFKQSSEIRVAKWSHIIALYETDNGPNMVDGLRALPHLTDEHVYLHKLRKMKVKHAAQIFSQRVASTMNFLSNLEGQNVFNGANYTAHVLYFFDKLFDSVNGSKKIPTKGKILRCGISNSTGHLQFWREAVGFLETIQFVDPATGSIDRPPSLKNWTFTIKNIINIWKSVKSDDFNYLLGRHLNQDPIENFFGQIRSHGIQNSNPTASAFIGAFKVLTINSSLNLYNPAFNCEKDDATYLCSGLKLFLNCAPPLSITMPESLPQPSPLSPASISPSPVHSGLVMTVAQLSNNYVAGFLLKKIKQKSFICDNCKKAMFCQGEDNRDNFLITSREYGGEWAKRLCYPTVQFAKCFKDIQCTIIKTLKGNAHRNTLSHIIRDKIGHNVWFDFIECTAHKVEIVNFIVTLCIRTLVHAYCQDINKVIMGKDCRAQTSSDPLKKRAIEISQRRRKKVTM